MHAARARGNMAPVSFLPPALDGFPMTDAATDYMSPCEALEFHMIDEGVSVWNEE